MDCAGAEVLRQRLAQQENWCQALAVRMGRQSAVDPDGHALETFRGDVRYYRAEHRLELRGGHRELVTRYLSKRLIHGRWETDELVDRARQVA
jgi:hypothetical protein